MRIAPLLLALLMAGCDKKPVAPAEPETAAYDAWRKTQLPLPFPAGAISMPARLTIYPPDRRAKNPSDFGELFVNYQKVGRFRLGPMPDGRFPAPVVLDLTLRSGPNWIDFWDSSSDRNCRQQARTQDGTELELHPTEEGYELRQRKNE